MPRRLTRRLAATASVVAAVFALSGCASQQPRPAARPTAELSGAYTSAGNSAALSGFGTFRGRPATIATDFFPDDSWAALASPTWYVNRWRDKGYQLAWAVPMLPKSGGTMADGAAGRYNGYFASMARTLVDAGQGHAILRLGWEMNGTWLAWSAVPDAHRYVAYWRQVVTSMRAVKGSSFLFDWNPTAGAGTAGFDVTSAYPGDAFVDIIGDDVYDQSWKHSSTHVAARWNTLVHEPFGLSWHVRFAAAHHKPNSLPEWGLSVRCDGHGGNDNPYFVRKIHGWLSSHDYAYDSYFSHDVGSCERHTLTSGDFARSADVYRHLFGTPLLAARG